jgi:hypothetical protein
MSTIERTEDEKLDLKYARDWLDLARTDPGSSVLDTKYTDSPLPNMENRLELARATLEDIDTNEQEIKFIKKIAVVGAAHETYTRLKRREEEYEEHPERLDDREQETMDNMFYRIVELEEQSGLAKEEFEECMADFDERPKNDRHAGYEWYQNMREKWEPRLSAEREDDVFGFTEEKEDALER